MRIKFIITGDLEKASIVDSVSRFFPKVISENGNRVDVLWIRPRKVHSVTSKRLDGVTDYSEMKLLAKAMIAEAEIGDQGTPADLVIAVDDLELGNQNQASTVTQHVKHSIESQIEERSLSMAKEKRLRETIREKCSFHLFAPMVESYFFGDPDALIRAGMNADRTPFLINNDVEDFESNDPAWLPICQKENAILQTKLSWWRHERHPKHYLEFLVEENGGFYAEMLGGIAAFSELNWPIVPADNTAAKFARSLFEDIAEKLCVKNPLAGTTANETWPTRNIRRNQLLLRNM